MQIKHLRITDGNQLQETVDKNMILSFKFAYWLNQILISLNNSFLDLGKPHELRRNFLGWKRISIR